MDEYADLIGNALPAPVPKRKVRQPLVELTARQRAFVLNYLADPEMNATKAARDAGYAEKSAVNSARDLLAKPAVQKFMRDHMRRREVAVEAKGEDVLRALMGVAFGDIRQLYNEDGTLKSMHELSDDAASMLASVDVETRVEKGRGGASISTAKIRRWDKMRALELLGKHLGMFKDTVEHTGPNGAPIQVELVQFGETIEGTATVVDRG